MFGRRSTRGVVSLCIALALVATACGDDPSDSGNRSTPPPSELAADIAAADFDVQGSVNQIFVTGAEPGTDLGAFDPDGQKVADGSTDDQGSLVFRTLESGHGYRVQALGADPAPTSDPIEVMSVEGSQPTQDFYDSQSLEPGLEYITTRDGTTLSAAVYLPGPIEDGPYPTVVEYSGYSPSNPTRSLEPDLQRLVPGVDTKELCRSLSFICDTPDQPGSMLAAAMGYAVVAVNVRGTGCSGGAYDFFETLQLLDGYDVIETVASQPWVKNGKVGMVGLSYPGIAQLFVASTQPPHLAAITPLSVYDDTARGVLAPGGIFNSGFALAWAREVLDNAKPYGQGWTKTVSDQGDTTCAANQGLRLQNVDAVAKAQAYTYYDPEIADPVNTGLLAGDIEVPTFLACAFQDEQTGGRCARIADKFTSAPVQKFTFYNGAHSDGFAPQVLVEWKAFLDFYVAGELTPINPLIESFAPELLNEIFGVRIGFPEQRWLNAGTFDEAKAAFEAEDDVRIIFENGGAETPGAPVGRFEVRYPSWPIDDAVATSWYLQPDGGLSFERPPEDGGASAFVHDPALGSKVTLPGDGSADAFKALPPYDWANDRPDDATVFVSEPLTEPTTMVGTGNADLWIQATAPDVDVSVTLSEVRPDGNETYVQSGFLRSSLRKLAPDSTELDPIHTGYEMDAEPLPAGEWSEAQMEIFPFAHVFRPGSRIRISIHTPGGDRPRWAWILQEYPTPPTIAVAHDAEHPSRVVLPVVENITGTPVAYPACPSLRGQPCRAFVPYVNRPFEG